MSIFQSTESEQVSQEKTTIIAINICKKLCSLIDLNELLNALRAL